MYPMRGRYAPSPTGYLHVGNARTALVAWLSARSAKGSLIWRLEDLDGPRVVPGMAEAAEEDLQWLGMDWDEGPVQGGAAGPYVQSQRQSYYEQALKVLFHKGYLFPCSYSRKDIQQLSSAPHEISRSVPYPVSLRPEALEEDWFVKDEQTVLPDQPYAAIRFKVPDRDVLVRDRLFGVITENVRSTVGDFVLKRKDGMYAYQLAVVVDDIAMGITEVVRGTDLLTSTPRQLLLYEALEAKAPSFAHVPLVKNQQGEKLSKRDQSLTLRSLRERGVQPEHILGYMGFSLGLIETLQAVTMEELLERFSWQAIRKEATILPEDLPGQLLAL